MVVTKKVRGTMEDNQAAAADTAGKIPEKEIGRKAKASRDAAAHGGIPEREASRAAFGAAAAGTSDEGRGMLKKKYPTPQELRREEAALPDIPSKVSLSDIPLPGYMKGATGPKRRAQGTSASILQSAREAGLDPRRPAKNEARIVAVKETHRSELDENGLPAIRTYAADMNREIQKKGATLASIVGEERERAAKVAMRTDAPRLSARKAALAIGIGLFVVVGVGAIATAIILNKKEDPVASEAPLIRANARATVEVTDASPLVEALARAREDSAISLGEVASFIITKDGLPLQAKAALEALGAPPALARNATRVMLGVHAFNRNQPFIIVRTSFYDSSFQAMLAWETSMAETLKDFFAPAGAGAPPPLAFSDAIFKNIDIRQSTGAWPIVYAFPAKDTLIVTTNTNTLNEILTRLATGPR